MSYKIELYPQVIRQDFPKIPKRAKTLIKSSIQNRLRTHPARYGVHLHGVLKGFFKLCVSDYRVIFSVSGKTVTIIAIGYRGTIYKNLLKRLQ